LFEKGRSAKVARLSEVRIKLFEFRAAANVHQAVATCREAEVAVTLFAEMEAEGIERFHVDFVGAMAKSNAIKTFLDPQLRTATDHQFEAQYALTFKDGLSTQSDKADEFIKAMTKYGSGEAYVEARAAAPKKD
jgi:hypothetical protein